MNIKYIYIHVGMPKAGSSSIQKTLLMNQQLLRANDYYYPITDPERPVWNHSQLFLKFFSRSQSAACPELQSSTDLIRKQTDDQFKGLVRESIASGCGKLVFSGEGISNLHREEVTTMVDYLLNAFSQPQITFILYLRNPYAWCNSAIQHYNTWGNVHLREIAKNPPLPRFRQLIEKFQSQAPGCRLIVQTLEQSTIAGERHEANFLNTIGITEEIIKRLELISIRHALSLESSILLELFKTYDSQNHLHREELLSILRFPGQNFRMPEKFLSNHSNFLFEDNDWIQKEFHIKYNPDGIPQFPLAFRNTDQALICDAINYFNKFYECKLKVNQVNSDLINLFDWFMKLE